MPNLNNSEEEEEELIFDSKPSYAEDEQHLENLNDQEEEITIGQVAPYTKQVSIFEQFGNSPRLSFFSICVFSHFLLIC